MELSQAKEDAIKNTEDKMNNTSNEDLKRSLKRKLKILKGNNTVLK